MDNIRKAIIIEKDKSLNCSGMTHYTILYRGRDYTVTIKKSDITYTEYEVNDKVFIRAYPYKGSLSVSISSKI